MSLTNAEWLREFIAQSARTTFDMVQLTPDDYERFQSIAAELERPTFEAELVWEGVSGQWRFRTREAVSREEWAKRLGWTPQPGDVVQVSVKGGEG